ncbi:hypothetical protein SALBM311S_05170 [Streptomyces alboniger]
MTPSAITQSSSPASAASAGATLSDLIVQSLTRHSSSEAFVAGDRRLTYAQVRDLVSQYMGALSRRGVGLGVGVTMLSPNTPEYWIVQAAAYLLGGRFTGLQALASVQDQIVVCEDAEAAVLGSPADHPGDRPTRLQGSPSSPEDRKATWPQFASAPPPGLLRSGSAPAQRNEGRRESKGQVGTPPPHPATPTSGAPARLSAAIWSRIRNKGSYLGVFFRHCRMRTVSSAPDVAASRLTVAAERTVTSRSYARGSDRCVPGAAVNRDSQLAVVRAPEPVRPVACRPRGCPSPWVP